MERGGYGPTWTYLEPVTANIKLTPILVVPRQRERDLYLQPTGPSPPHRLNDSVDRPCAMGVLNSPSNVA